MNIYPLPSTFNTHATTPLLSPQLYNPPETKIKRKQENKNSLSPQISRQAPDFLHAFKLSRVRQWLGKLPAERLRLDSRLVF